jgi:hypothetical protein
MDYALKLGEWVVVGRGWIKRQRIMFAGEVSPGVYSLVGEWTNAHNSAAFNVYFQKSQREFSLLGGRVVVVDVSKHEIRFQFVRRPQPVC